MNSKYDTKIPSGLSTRGIVQVEVCTSFEELTITQQDWDQLIKAVHGDIFLTYDWCRTWWKYYGGNRDLRILIFHNNGKLIGIIPLFTEKIWLGPVFIRAIKIVGSDFTLSQFGLPIQSTYLNSVVQALLSTLSKFKWDVVHLGPIAGLYSDFNVLKDAFYNFCGKSLRVHDKITGVQTYFELPDSKEEYISGLSKNARKTIKRSYKRISNESNKPVSQLTSRENFNKDFDAFIQMHTLAWKKKGKSGHFGDWPKAYEFHKDLAQRQINFNRLRLLRVQLGDQVLGYRYGYKFGDKYYALQVARSMHINEPYISIGKILFIEDIRAAIAEKIRFVDSMRGKYDYKIHLGGKLFPLKGIYIIKKNILTLSRIFLFTVGSKVLDLCYYKIWYCRIAPKLPFEHRPLWEIWIRTCAFSN